MFHQIIIDLKNLKVTYRDNNYVLVPPVLLLLVELILYFTAGLTYALLAALPLVLLVVLAIQFHLYRKTEEDLEEERKQYQALADIYGLIDIRTPLPSMTEWAASPVLARTVIGLIDELDPGLVLEAGSGASTIVTCYRLEKKGQGELITLDHDEDYSRNTDYQLKAHALGQTGTVQFAPLKEYEIEGTSWLWYDFDPDALLQEIDLVVVDGPPVKTQPMARYPALPLLFNHLSDRAAVVLDDANRGSEQLILERWLELYPIFDKQMIGTQKGIAVLKNYR